MLLAGAPSSAQTLDLEVFAGASLLSSLLDTVYEAPYTPSRVEGIGQLFAQPDLRSRARQALTLDGETGAGVGLGLNLYPHAVWGAQVLFDASRAAIGGDNGPHEIDLTWTTINFPFSDQIERTATFVYPAVDTEGSLTSLAVSVNAIARLKARPTIGGAVSGGLTYFRLRGEAERLGAFAAWLGGHAVLFSELYEFGVAIEPAETVGFNIGGNVDVSVGRHVAVFADLRLFKAPTTGATVRLERVLSDNVVAVPLSRIDAFLALEPIEIDPGFTRLLVGLAWRP